MKKQKLQKGSAMLLALIFICLFSALAVSLCSMSGVNLQIAKNQRGSNRARYAAESGLEATKFWFATDANGFAGISHILSSTEQSSFIVDVEGSGDPNLLWITVIGKAGDFSKQIGGDFHRDTNNVWRFDANSYFEN